MRNRPENQPIENLPELVHEIVNTETLMPHGEYDRPLVDNPRLDSHPPTYLRIAVPRKGFTFNLVSVLEAWNLKIADVWQLDRDKESDRIQLRVEVAD